MYAETQDQLAEALGVSVAKLRSIKISSASFPKKTSRGWKVESVRKIVEAYEAKKGPQGRKSKGFIAKNPPPVTTDEQGRPANINWVKEKDKELALERRYKRLLLEGILVYKDDVIRLYAKHVQDAANRLRAIPKLVSNMLTTDGLREILDGTRDSRDLVSIIERAVTEQIDDVCRTLNRGTRPFSSRKSVSRSPKALGTNQETSD